MALIKRLSNNQIKVNTDKSYLLLNSRGWSTMKTGNLCLKKSSCEKNLDISIDYKLNFEKRVDGNYQKALKK